MEIGKNENRRVHERRKIVLPGWFKAADDIVHPCIVLDVSLNGAAIMARERGSIGDLVVIFADPLGRLEGRIVRLFEGGFGVALTGNSHAAEAYAREFFVN
jgi:hypothetical protein